jgi:hypothetical protein
MWVLIWGGVMGVAAVVALFAKLRIGARLPLGLPLTVTLLFCVAAALGAGLGLMSWYGSEYVYRRARREREAGRA